MISRYNRSQAIKAVLFAIGGLGCCWLAYLFFRYVPVFLAWQFGQKLSATAAVGIGLLGVGSAWFSAWRTWKARGGLFGYNESGLYHDLGEDTAGAVVVDHYAHRVTGPAYLLGQIFMAGPQFILKARALLRSRIPPSVELEARLERALATLRSANKWQGFQDHPELQSEILHLAQMGLIDFGRSNGTARFKAL